MARIINTPQRCLERHKGHVKWFDLTRSYGFVVDDTGGGEVFFHKSTVHGDPANFTQDTPVEFAVEDGPKGPRCQSIRLVIGE